MAVDMIMPFLPADLVAMELVNMAVVVVATVNRAMADMAVVGLVRLLLRFPVRHINCWYC
jgi:hypothetical protein